MAINLSDGLHAATTKGKLADAKEIYLEGDTKNLQQSNDEQDSHLSQHDSEISEAKSRLDGHDTFNQNQTQKNTELDANMKKLNERDDQITELIKGVTTTGGASVATAVSYDNTASKLTAATAQGAIDEIVEKTAVKNENGEIENTPFHYIQNEEFIFAKVDADDRLLFGIQYDGTPVFGKTSKVEDNMQEQITTLANRVSAIIGDDDNTSVIDTMNELKKFFASIENTQTLTDILSTISNLQSTKVDKEEGKSLTPNEINESFEVIENEEWLHAVVDSEQHLLFGIKREDGKPYFPQNELYHIITNDEWLAAWLDEDDKVIMGIKEDGYLYMRNKELDDTIAKLNEVYLSVEALKELTSCFSQIENDEYLEVTTDADGRVVAATYPDGSHYLHNVKSETIPTEFSTIEDPEERLEVTTDADGRVVAERLSDGEKHEVKMNVDNLKVSNLNLQGNSVQNIEDALKANGFSTKSPIDWSESSFIQIPEPRFAIANITGVDKMPTTKTQNLHAWMEFWDMQGNYFKKRVILNAQGNSSMSFVKKNAAIDICNDEWIGDDTAKIRFGNWVPQDSFHLKAYYTDFFRGVGVVCYKFYEQVVKTRGNMYDKPWKKALIDMDSIGVTTKSLGNQLVGHMDLQTDTGALCHPDGFPMALYLNGEFYGVFSWQLKKHRDNYHMDKSTAEHVHLDGHLINLTIFGGKDNINWSEFEIRNPKGLYAIGGNKYDADIKQEEIAGEDEVNSWIDAEKLPDGTAISSKIKKNLQMTAKVKKYIQSLADAVPTIQQAASVYEASSKTEDDLKSFKDAYESYFDVENQTDFLVVSDIIGNTDGFRKNWQWITYDGKKWWVEIYDCDVTFGASFEGKYISDPKTSHLSAGSASPNMFIVKYYQDSLINRYKELADAGIASADNIFHQLKEWTMRIGTSFYKEEYKKWEESPCISDSVVRSDYWELLVDEEGNPQTDTSETFDATTAYNVDDIVSFGYNTQMGFFKFKCIKQTVAQSSNTPHAISTYSPIKIYKHCDNIYRIQKWIAQNIRNMDKLYKYSRI